MTSEIDAMARALYDARAKPCPPISDNAWAQVKVNTPNHYGVLIRVAEGLMENE